MRYWLLKSDVQDYSIDDLARDKKTDWTGVRNYQARNFMQKEMGPGDLAFFYHSNAEPSGISGIVRILGAPKPDKTQFDSKSKYFDETATKEKPRWFLREIEFVEKLPRFIDLSQIRKIKACQKMWLLRPGSRLSITPVTEGEWKGLLDTLENFSLKSA